MMCPKCQCELQPEGELVIDGSRMHVYQCDECTRPWHVGTSTFDVALTFAVDARGRLFDPETFEPLTLN